MIRNFLSAIIPLTVLPVAFISVQRFSSAPIGGTIVYWLIHSFILIVFGVASFVLFEPENKRAIQVVKWYLLWNVISIVRGIFVAETYWDYKGLVEMGMALLIPIIAYAASNKEILQSILSFYVKYALVFSITLLPFLTIGGLGWYLFPVSLLMLFFPAIKFKWKILLLAISIIVILGDLNTRSHTVKYGIPILLLSFYYLRAFPWSSKVIEFTRNVLIIAPWILFFLGVSGVFNVFKINEYIHTSFVAETKNAEGEIKRQDITEDSRTFIYTEVLQSAKKHNYWVMGRSPARGNETTAFAKIAEITGREERLRNEANIPNVFTWTGSIGVLLIFFIFYRASWLAINRSNNIYIKLIGLFVAFRWLYAWIEDYYAFDINLFTVWFMIGICFSESFRNMNNAEVKLWIRGIFAKKYQTAYLDYARNYMTDSI